MAILHSGAGKYQDLNDDDYRAYLITRNQAPIVYHSQDIQFKRLRVHVRSALFGIDRFLHWMSQVIAKSTRRRIWRELMMRGVYHHYAPYDREARSPREVATKIQRDERGTP
jgi:hypothetical protein